MFLVVDVGNSHTVTGMIEDGRLAAQWRLKSDSKSTADELALSYYTLFQMAGIDQNRIRGVIIASVVPTLLSAWISCCKNHLSLNLITDVIVVDVEGVRDLISVKLDNPKEVGTDRLVNAIAAWNLNKCKQVIIDFGTAITFDCVTEKCEYLGGAILPGIAISLEALSNKTAQLPHIDVSEGPKNIIGKSTVQAMKSGILFGYGAMIDGLVRGIRQEMTVEDAEDFKVVATGGMARVIAPYASSIEIIDPLLTLKGLEIIYNHYQRR